jgi:hypothetical protein
MPFSIIPVSPFPNVPALPGVPQLVRSLLFPAAPLPNLGETASPTLWAASQGLPKWGIFNAAGIRVINPDNVFAFDNRNEWRIPDFPIQQGSFASYNKVIIPFELSLRLTKGGSLSDRTAFLKSIETIASDLNLYTVLTPEKSYISVNVIRYEVTRRSSEGAYFLEVDIFFKQINQVAAQYSTTAVNTSNAQNPAAVPPVNQGLIQPSSVVPSAATIKANSAIAQTVQ